MVKNLPANAGSLQKTQVWSLGQEDPLEEETAAHSSILTWEIPWIEEPGGLQSMGVAKELDMTKQRKQQSFKLKNTRNLQIEADQTHILNPTAQKKKIT